MLLAGLQKQVLSYDTLRHQEHDNSQRGTNQNVVHPIVNTHYYRALCSLRTMWSRHEESPFSWVVDTVTPKEVRFHVKDSYVEQEDPIALDTAINLVIGWYASKAEIDRLSRQEKLKLIWERSSE